MSPSENVLDGPASLRRRWQWKILSSTWLAYFGYYFCRKAFFVVKGSFGLEFELSSIDLAHIGSGYLIGYAVGQFSSAWAGGKLGPKRLLLFGMGISLSCNLVFGFNNGFWSVLVFMVVNGLAQGTGWPGCIGSLSYWFTRQKRGSVLGVWSTCYQVGSLAATSFAAFLLGAMGWRWSFFGASMVLMAVWACVLWLHPNTPEDVGLKSVKDDEPHLEQSDSEAKKPVLTRQALISILLMGTIYFCIKFLRYALWSWTPYFLSNNFDLQGDQAGYLSTVFDLCGFVSVLIAGALSDRWFNGRRALLSLIMLVGMALSFIVMALWGAHSVFFFASCLGLTGLMLYGPDSLISGVGAIDVGSIRGALVAAGIINGMGSIGPVFQEQLVGWMYMVFNQSLEPILVMFAIIAVVSAILMLVLTLLARKGKSNI